MPARKHTERHRRALYAEALAVLLIDAGYELSVDEVAARLATSRRALQRSFAEVGGTTFREQAAKARLGHAAVLLQDLSLTVEAVASATGFSDASAFAKAFRRRYGVSPGAARRRVRPLTVPVPGCQRRTASPGGGASPAGH